MILKEHINNSLRDMVTNIKYICYYLSMEKTNKKQGVTIMTNQKWKNYEPDKKMVELFSSLEELKQKRKKEHFKNWLNLDVKLNESHALKVKNILEYLIENVNTVVETCGLSIGNEKELRDNIATMIYRRSQDGM